MTFIIAVTISIILPLAVPQTPGANPTAIELESIPTSTRQFAVEESVIHQLALITKKAKLTASDAETIALAYKQSQFGIGGVLHPAQEHGDSWFIPFDGCLGPISDSQPIVVLKSNGAVSFASAKRFDSVKKLYEHLLTPRSSRTPPALPFALSLHFAISAPLIVSVQAWPLSFFR